MSFVSYHIGDIYTPISYEDFENAIVIIGMADKGPSMIPVYLASAKHVEHIFGRGSELANNCLEAFLTGANRVIAFRINGVHPQLTITDWNDNPLIDMVTIHASEEYNQMRVEIHSIDEDKSIQIYDINGQLQKIYRVHESQPIAELCKRINYESTLGRVEVIATPEDTTLLCSSLQDTPQGGIFFYGGLTEHVVMPEVIFNRLQRIYGMLETIDFDIVVPLPVRYLHFEFIDNVGQSFYNQLSDLCASKAAYGLPITAIIPADEFEGSPPEYVQYLEEKADDLLRELKRTKDIVVVASKVITPFPAKRNQDYYISNGSAALAGLMNSIRPQISPSNKTLDLSLDIAYEFTVDEMQRLASIGICTFRRSLRKGLVVSNGITSIDKSSIFSPIKDSRLSNHITKTVFNEFYHYIGDTSLNSMSSADKRLNDILDQMQRDGLFIDYRYAVTSDYYGTKLDLDIEVIPYGEIKFISVSVAVYL